MKRISAAILAVAALAAPAFSYAEQRLGSPAFTAEQAKRGKATYSIYCVACHGVNLVNGAQGPALAGEDFDAIWRGQTVGALYQFVRERMPLWRPGSLKDEAYADLVAYILATNGLPPGDSELPPDQTKLDTMMVP
jgi:mono/diheme cytochrome c family protein